MLWFITFSEKHLNITPVSNETAGYEMLKKWIEEKSKCIDEMVVRVRVDHALSINSSNATTSHAALYPCEKITLNTAVSDGILSASTDANTKGIDINYTPDDDSKNDEFTKPRILIKKSEDDDKLLAHIWTDPISDRADKIEFDNDHFVPIFDDD